VSKREIVESVFTINSKRDEIKGRSKINNYTFNPSIVAFNWDVKRGGEIDLSHYRAQKVREVKG
jgi:hypothetical protein